MYKFGGKIHSFFLNALRMLQIKFCTIFIFLSVFISCKKEQSSVPVLTGEITTPQNGFNCDFGDTITVIGNLSCDYPIQSAFVTLVDDNFNTIVSARLIGEALGTSHQFSTPFILDNQNVSSGDYLIRISARSQDQTIYLEQTKRIHVTAIPRTTLKTFCVAGSPMNPKIYELNGGIPTLIGNYNLTFLNLHIDSRYKQIYVCGKEKVIGLNSETNAEEFQISPLALNSDSFVTTELFDNKIVLGRNDGNIIYYNSSGQRQNETGENLFIRPLLTTSTSGNLYTSILKNSDRKIAVNFLPGGSARQELLIDFDIVRFHPVSSTEILVTGNRNGHTLICKYNLNTNNINTLADFPLTYCNSSISYYQGIILLLTSNGMLKYDYGTNGTQTRSLTVFNGANYDEVNDILYCFSGSNIKQLNGTSYTDMGSYSLPDSVMSVGVLYSK